MKKIFILGLFGLLFFLTTFSTLAQQVNILTNHMMLEGKRSLIRQSAASAGFKVNFYQLSSLDDAKLRQRMSAAVTLIDIPRGSDMAAFKTRMAEFAHQLPYPSLSFSRHSFSYTGLDKEIAEKLHPYYHNGGDSNFTLFFKGLKLITDNSSANTPAVLELPAAITLPAQGAYHPRFPAQFSHDPADILTFLGHDQSKAVIALGFHVRYLESNALEHINQLVQWIENKGATALPVFYSLGPDAKLKALLKEHANVLIHLQPVYHNGLKDQLIALNIPVIQGIGWWNDSIENWQKNKVGLSLPSTPLYLALPEQNGLIDPIVMWAEKEGELTLIPYQAKSVINKALNLAALQKIPPMQQKLAIMVYNYPPGEQNLSASFMNVPRSLALLSDKWRQAGYQTDSLSEDELIKQLGESIQATHQRDSFQKPNAQNILTLAEYQQWFDTLPEHIQNRINQYWGQPQESSMLKDYNDEKVFMIPHFRSGNIVYLGQPPRGLPGQDNEKAMYHDLRIPVNHYYLATYLWVRESFAADALVHFGTHGTQEWMPGKERGLSIYDDPYLALGDTPVIYPYIIDNVGEATQAKRRGRAVMISHQTPPFRPSGLHGLLVDMHLLIHQWETLEPGQVRDNTVTRLLTMAANDELDKTLGFTQEQAKQQPAEFILALHDYLHELAAQSQPIGLHTYADDDITQQKLTTVMQMLGDPFLQSLDLDQPDEMFVDDYQKLTQTAPYQWLYRLLIERKDVIPKRPKWQQKAQLFYDSLTVSGEWQSLQRSLKAEHIEPGIGGDPIRVPDSLPSGKNLVGFDPARVPTKEAWLAGKEAAKQLIAQFKQDNGEWPKRLAFSLWAVEAMRHGGILESQAFYAMGVEPTWDRSGRVNGFTIIDREQLARPRVDVVLSVTGLYRDQFPNVMEHLAKAAAKVAMLNEDDNPVYSHTQQLLADLRKQNIDADKALSMAQTRVFGSPTGVYGTGLEDALLATETWESDEKLATLYLQRMSYAFGPDSQNWGKGNDKSTLYAENLKTVDAALLARSSNLYGMLTTDDPFQYLGGIELAVRHLTGNAPQLLISNQRQTGKVKFQSAQQFLAIEMTTRAFHPGWITAMQEEGFAGALNLQDMTNNLWGWQVVSPYVVQDHQWQKMHEIYVMDSLDLNMQEWFEQHSPEARLRMMERMLDAIRKDYWQADQVTQQELIKAYQQAIEQYHLQPAHEKLARFADTLAQGFGLQAFALTALSASEQDNKDSANSPSEQQVEVQGQQLEKQQTHSTPTQSEWWLAFLIVPILLGAGREYYRLSRGKS